jgi:ubiquinone/menaquinone biosynthesis C-methylase UbiE
MPRVAIKRIEHVEESVFGVWFLGTTTWVQHVLCRALDDLQNMMEPGRIYKDVLDVGCGQGKALNQLDNRFKPQRIVGVDPDPDILAEAKKRALDCRCAVTFVCADAADTKLPDASFDMVFCHQTFHHIVDQEKAIGEFYRLLRPGGVLLFAESTKRYIHSWIIRLLFRHPMDVQKTAEEYIALLRNAGFKLAEERISFPYLWWSRPDLGLLEKMGIPSPDIREETLINAIAVKPA